MKKKIIYSTLMAILFITITSNAQMIVGDMKVGQGVTPTNSWVDYTSGIPDGIYIDVNTSACGFTNTPHYLVTLESTGSGYHWQVSGTTSIYSPTPTGFRIYLRWTDHPDDGAVGVASLPNPLTAKIANSRGWVVRWTGIETGGCSNCGSVPKKMNSSSMAPGDEETSFNSKVDNDNIKHDLKIYPNPTSNEFSISASHPILKSELYNYNGILLKTFTEDKTSIQDLSNGNYIVKVYFQDDSIVETIVKID